MSASGRCRRCGAMVSSEAEAYTHVLPVRTENGTHAVFLRMCRPCGADLSTLRDRDEYVRLTYFG